MKLLIDVESRYCKDLQSDVKELYYGALNRITEAVRNGIPYDDKPQGDLISREALKKAIETCEKFACLPDTKLMPFYRLNEPEKNYEPYVHLRDIKKAIDNAPAVEYTFEAAFQKTVCDQRLYCPERPQGEWIIDGHHRRCKKCGEYFCIADSEGNEIPSNFCPNCGARMQKGD